MFNLIKNELIKIFSKKAIYIILGIFLFLSVAGFALTKFIDEYEETFDYIEEEIFYHKTLLKTIDKSTPEDKLMYSEIKTHIDVLELVNKYGEESWQSTIIYERLSEIIADINYYENGLDSYVINSALTKEELIEEYNEILEKLENDDWRSFAEEDLSNARENKKMMDVMIEQLKDSKNHEVLKSDLDMINIDIQVLEWRLEKNIYYGHKEYEYLLEQYEMAGKNIISSNYEHGINQDNYKEKKSNEFNYAAKKQYQEELSTFNIAKYKIENNITSQITATDTMKTIFESDGILFVVIIAVMVAGTTVSEEINKGTIKLLLIRPYSRRKILLSKLIACIITIIFALVSIGLIQLVMSGITYGFDTLDTPVVMYNFNTNSIISLSVFKYIFISLINISPIIFILTSIAFLFGTVFASSSTGITVGLLLYMLSGVVENLAMEAQKAWMKFIPMVNWDLSQHLYGKLPILEGTTLLFSILISVITMESLLIITFENFKRKDIKNI